jgi:beta-lactamase superfamily II metal-dependent hydrolase
MQNTVDIMENVLRYFSKWDHAVQSLNYVFADIIIPILIAMLIVCLVIKLKHKWLMIIPPTVAILAFGICLVLTHIQQPPKAVYAVDGKEEMIVISENGRSILCDISCDSADVYYESYYLANDLGANKIDTLILAHLSQEHPNILERIGRFTIIDTIRVPTPTTRSELDIVSDIVEVADSIGAVVHTYNEEEI